MSKCDSVEKLFVFATAAFFLDSEAMHALKLEINGGDPIAVVTGESDDFDNFLENLLADAVWTGKREADAEEKDIVCNVDVRLL